MSYSVPYSFIPGTKARAQDVNANFNAVTDYLELLEANKVNNDLSNISAEGVNLIKNNSSRRNIGELIYTLIPIQDANLHLLDGSLLYSGVYSDFIDYIADLYAENPSANYFTTESDWQTAVTTYGVCGKFVYDSTNNTVRLPKVTGIIEGTTDVTALGDLVEAGLPNHDHIMHSKGAINGSYYLTKDAQSYSGGGSDYFGRRTSVDSNLRTGNASENNPIYGNSSTVQPQTIKAFYYIVIATSTKTDIQIDIDNVVTDLNGKADTDLSNINASQSAKAEITSWGIPDYSAGISVTYPLSGNPFTAPSYGIFCAWGKPTDAAIKPIINGIQQDYLRLGELANGSGGYTGRSYLLSKNDVIYFNNSYDDLDGCTFYPLKGAN